ncbi:MAG: type II toxin-antitoxin system PemK/MazF family toxin [Mycobacteriales bacterium]|nr:type II toxin-antitoxin system PemK/MazF family toxin [Mycobacteriales bacterium]
MAMRWAGLARAVGAVAVRQAPRVLRQVRRARAGAAQPRRGPVRGGPRQTLSYAPQPDGRADPGEVVWTWVAYEEDPSKGKDRPVVVVGRDGATLLGLMLSSNSDRDGQRGWLSLGVGPWDGEDRPSWVRLDRVLQLREDAIRREGAVLDRRRFDRIATALRKDHGWS